MTIYQPPALSIHDKGGDVDVRISDEDQGLVLGEDLVMVVEPLRDAKDGMGMRVAVRLCDGSANHLTTLALVNWAVLNASLPILAETARTLYPTFVRIPASSRD